MTTAEKVIKTKVGLLELGKQLTVVQTCPAHFRGCFYLMARNLPC
jgi:hypothetical protein